VAATGNVSGRELTTSVFPFILRDVALLGVDSASVAAPERRLIWERLSSDLRPKLLEERTMEIGLDGLAQAIATVLAGDARGRYLVRLAG
jgi:alcohol dehydrogenase